MARSKTGSKSPGYDFWSSRPGSGGSGPEAKGLTHRAERQDAKREVAEAICNCRKPALVTDDTYCFNCHKPTKEAFLK